LPIAPRAAPSKRGREDFEAKDAKALARELAETSSCEVRFDDGSRALYATDASNYRQVPIGVVVPRSVDDVIATVATSSRFGVPILCRGGGTSLAGQCCNVAVVIDFSKYMNRILEVDAKRRFARVEPGVVLDDLRDAAEKHGLTVGPDPATHNRCTLGGMIGNNSCGVHALMAGKTVDNVETLDVLTYDGLRMTVGPTSDADVERLVAEGGRRGEIYRAMRGLRDRYADTIRERYPHIPRRVSGYNLDSLLPEAGFDVARALVGSESTLVTVLEAKLKLVPSPPHRTLLVMGFDDVYTAADHVPEVLEGKPIGLEGLDDKLIAYMRRKKLHTYDLQYLPEGKGWLIAELGGDSKEEADDRARALADRMKRLRQPPSMKTYDSKAIEKEIWEVRESGLGATARVPGEPDGWPGWEDSAVDPKQLGQYMREFRKLLDDYGYHASLYGHFGQGCLHCRISFDLYTKEGVAKWRRFLEEAAHLVVRHGGSLSGEHGDGQARAELLPIMFGDEIVGAFREFKSIWDPAGKMNPGKVVDPYPIVSNLRFGQDWEPENPPLHIKLDEDDSFARAATRCVGVGLCRKHDGGTMCPSYMVTREEMHSTRGRAHLLFETMTGGAIDGGMHDPHVKEALDLCLACKACKAECPVNVDMATYKSEFLAHYYERHARPLAAYAFGYIDVFARIASKLPRLANFLVHGPGFEALTKKLLGIDGRRTLPPFARRSFRSWFTSRPRPTGAAGGPRVVLWADTFNDFFHPEVAIAAVRSLEKLGYAVDISPEGLCCGRPLYDFGFLGTAKKRLERIVHAMRADIHDGIPLVGLEPSCVSVFRDEMPNLLVGDPDAQRLQQQTKTLAELLEHGPLSVEYPRLARRAVVHGHCHHKAVLGFDSESAVLEKLGLDLEVLDSGCCGMAGAFGFEASHYDVSIAAGERVLLPAVRRASDDTLIVADGFSCRTQIAETTERRALHLAQILEMALAEAAGEIRVT
jgi:FAD/FMN-containing dehydrogenase/Fe-S oxidoreductase